MRFDGKVKKEVFHKWPTSVPPLYKNIKAAHEWCKHQASIGGFYHHYTNTRWWFENEQDAILFALRWSGG